MSREFIPCLYHEWEGYDSKEGQSRTCYQVLELLPVSDLATHEETCLITKDCHQYMLDVTPSVREQPRVHAEKRAHLFAYLYETVWA